VPVLLLPLVLFHWPWCGLGAAVPVLLLPLVLFHWPWCGLGAAVLVVLVHIVLGRHGACGHDANDARESGARCYWQLLVINKVPRAALYFDVYMMD